MPGPDAAADAPRPGLPAPLDARGVHLVTRQGCHLCELAEPLAREVCQRHGRLLEVHDVDSVPALAQLFTAHVPVLVIDGLVVDFWQVRPDRMEAALRGEPVAPLPPLEA